MKLDFYLSEMSVSDKHGGGLTLQRILGNELNDIDKFIHVNRFAADYPVKGDLAQRSINLFSVWEKDVVRKLIGRSLAHKMSKMPVMIKLHANGAAKKIASIFKDKAELRALICPQGANAIFTLEALKKLKPVKYITWVMDDHLIYHKNGSWHYPEGTEAVFAKHLQEAEHAFVISPAMQQFYKTRFGVESTVLFGSAGKVDDGFQYLPHTDTPLRIGYFGAVAAWQRDALKAVADALSGTDTQLYIYSGIDKLPAELDVEGVHFKGSVPPEKVLAEMKTYDAVLLPISFQEKIRNMSQFNIATKMSEYLACGVPLLAVGPQYAAMINYLNDHNAAITVASDNAESIRNAFGLLRNPQRVEEILQNARKLTVNEVGEKPMRSVWQSVTGRGTLT